MPPGLEPRRFFFWLSSHSGETPDGYKTHVFRMNAARSLDRMMGFEAIEQNPPDIESALQNLFELSLSS